MVKKKVGSKKVVLEKKPYLSEKQYQYALEKSYDVKPERFQRVQSELGKIRKRSEILEVKRDVQRISESPRDKFFKSITPSKDKPAFNPQRLRPTQDFSPAQRMFQEVLGGGEQTWGSGNNLPKLNRSLTSGNGLINNGDFGETGNLFGIRR